MSVQENFLIWRDCLSRFEGAEQIKARDILWLSTSFILRTLFFKPFHLYLSIAFYLPSNISPSLVHTPHIHLDLRQPSLHYDKNK